MSSRAGRSTKDLGRIRQCLARYAAVVRHADLGGDAASLLFVVRSAARKENIQKLAVHLPLLVLRDVEAVEWMREEILGIEPHAGAPTAEANVQAVAGDAKGWMRTLLGVLHANGMKRMLDQAEPALMKEGHEKLVALYRTLKAAAGRGCHP